MCFHKWGKWGIIEEGELIGKQSGRKNGDYFIQEKKCIKCNLTKRNIVKNTN